MCQRSQGAERSGELWNLQRNSSQYSQTTCQPGPPGLWVTWMLFSSQEVAEPPTAYKHGG